MCDGIGGGVKCHAAKQSLQRPLNNHTSCGAGSMPRRNEIIYLLGIDKEDMVKVREKMEKRFEDGKTVPGTWYKKQSSLHVPVSFTNWTQIAVRMSHL